MKNKYVIYFVCGLVGISIFLLGFMIYFSILTTNPSTKQTLHSLNQVGDAIGGISSPFIGLTAVILTFMAFYVQYTFNRTQSQIYKESLLINKRSEFLKLIESIISINTITDITIKAKIESILNEKLDGYRHLLNIKFKNVFIETSLVNMFSKNLRLHYVLPQSIKRDRNNNDDVIKFELKNSEFIKLYSVFEQYYNLLVVYQEELIQLEIENITSELVLLDNKFDVLFGKDSYNFKYLCFIYLLNLDTNTKNTVFENFIKSKMNHKYQENLDFINFHIKQK